MLNADDTWKTTTGPIIFNGIRNGEFYDARFELPGWLNTNYDDETWDQAERVLPPGGLLEAQTMPPCKVMETLSVKRQYNPKTGGCVYDFGENIAGWCRIEVQGEQGTVVTLRYSERITEDGDIDQEHIGIFLPSGETQTDRYTLKGGPEPGRASNEFDKTNSLANRKNVVITRLKCVPMV